MKRFVEETDREQGTLLPECMEDCGPFAPGPRCKLERRPSPNFRNRRSVEEQVIANLRSLLAKVLA